MESYKVLNRFMNHKIKKPEDFFPTLKQSNPHDEEITRTKTISESLKSINENELTMMYLKYDIKILRDNFQN